MESVMEDKYLSIITNFGCHYTCPYCIVKENDLKVPKTTVKGLRDLTAIASKTGCNWISVSGGGDPLFHVREHGDWYEEYMRLTQEEGFLREMHTSIILPETEDFFWHGKFWNRIVYHLNTFTQLYSIQRRREETIRVVFVVTKDFTPALIDKIADFVKESHTIDELSFRQMVDSNYQPTDYCKKYLEEGHKKRWWYIQQGDYNLYYAENQAFGKFEDFKSE